MHPTRARSNATAAVCTRLPEVVLPPPLRVTITVLHSGRFTGCVLSSAHAVVRTLSLGRKTAAERSAAASASRYLRCCVSPRPVQNATLSSGVAPHKRYSMIARSRTEKKGTLPSRRRESGEVAEAPQLSTCRLLDALCKTGTRSANTVFVHSPDEGKSGLPRAPAISYVSCFGVCRLLWPPLSFACWRRALPPVSAWAPSTWPRRWSAPHTHARGKRAFPSPRVGSTRLRPAVPPGPERKRGVSINQLSRAPTWSVDKERRVAVRCQRECSERLRETLYNAAVYAL